MRSINISFTILLLSFLVSCSSPARKAANAILEREKVIVNYTSFFDEKNNRDITNLSLSLEVKPSRSLSQQLKKDGCAIKYDKETLKQTSESLDGYLAGLKDYTRYVFDFSVDSIKCKVFVSDKCDVLHIVMLDKYNDKYHFMNESYFVYGTILKTIEKDIRADDGDFEHALPEKTRVRLFDENKMFYQSEQKQNDAERSLSYNDEEAFLYMQDAFLFRQFCRDALLKLKETHPDWFNN